MILNTGTINTKCAKYKTVLICSNSINGDSTCLAQNCIIPVINHKYIKRVSYYKTFGVSL